MPRLFVRLQASGTESGGVVDRRFGVTLHVVARTGRPAEAAPGRLETTAPVLLGHLRAAAGHEGARTGTRIPQKGPTKTTVPSLTVCTSARQPAHASMLSMHQCSSCINAQHTSTLNRHQRSTCINAQHTSTLTHINTHQHSHASRLIMHQRSTCINAQHRSMLNTHQ